MKITLPKAVTIVKWRSVALAASILCSILELANIQTAEKSGYIAATSQQEIELAKLSLTIATDARLLSSKADNDQSKNQYRRIYIKSICKIEQLVSQGLGASSKQASEAKSCKADENTSIADIAINESELANSIDEWEKDTTIAATKQSEHTSAALQLNYLATILLLLFLALDLFDTYGPARDEQA